MTINYTNHALESLRSLILFIEETNTPGAGLRWLNRYEEFLYNRLQHHKTIRHCNNLTLRKFYLKCLHYNEWVIAFREEENELTIEAFFHYSRIVD